MNSGIARALGAAVALMAVPHALAAQQNACVAPDSLAAAVDSSGAGIPVVIIARVHADAVVFESDPDVTVRLNGCEAGPDAVVRTSNLPDTIVPGVRYTDVEITTEYRVRLELECRCREGPEAHQHGAGHHQEQPSSLRSRRGRCRHAAGP